MPDSARVALAVSLCHTSSEGRPARLCGAARSGATVQAPSRIQGGLGLRPPAHARCPVLKCLQSVVGGRSVTRPRGSHGTNNAVGLSLCLL